MKCKACLPVIGEYLDGELSERLAAHVADHINACEACASAYERTRHEQEVYSAYERDFEITPRLREMVRAKIEKEQINPISNTVTSIHNWFDTVQNALRLNPSGAIAITLALGAVVIVGLANYIRTAEIRIHHQIAAQNSDTNNPESGGNGKITARADDSNRTEGIKSVPEHHSSARNKKNKILSAMPVAAARIDRSNREPRTQAPDEPARQAAKKLQENDQLVIDMPPFHAEKFGDPKMVTLEHLEKSQMLLRSFRNGSFQVASRDDIAYEKQQSQKLLRRNVLLRCAAIAKGNLPEEEVLSSLEPILLDIANLPLRASPDDVRSIRETIKKSEIVAVLQVYSKQTQAIGY